MVYPVSKSLKGQVSSIRQIGVASFDGEVGEQLTPIWVNMVDISKYLRGLKQLVTGEHHLKQVLKKGFKRHFSAKIWRFSPEILRQR